MKNMIDITTIIEAVITLIAAIITAFIIPWIKSKVTEAQWINLCDYADTFVACAEMIFRGSKLGKDKKAWVIAKLTELSENKNLKISASAIEAAIEAAVKAMNDSKNEVIKDDVVI